MKNWKIPSFEVELNMSVFIVALVECSIVTYLLKIAEIGSVISIAS